MTRVAAALNADGRMEVFYIRADGALYHNWETDAGGWFGEVPLGEVAPLAKALAVGANQDGRLEVFYIGSDNMLYHNWQAAPNGGWDGGGALRGFGQAVAVGRNQDGRLE